MHCLRLAAVLITLIMRQGTELWISILEIRFLTLTKQFIHVSRCNYGHRSIRERPKTRSDFIDSIACVFNSKNVQSNASDVLSQAATVARQPFDVWNKIQHSAFEYYQPINGDNLL